MTQAQSMPELTNDDGGRAQNVLVADDDDLSVEFLQAMLLGDGFRVDVAYDGREALRLTRERSYDAVLLDSDLPFLDGLTLLQTLRADESAAGRNAKVYVITGYSAEALQQAYMAAGATAFFTKPIDTAGLLRLLHHS